MGLYLTCITLDRGACFYFCIHNGDATTGSRPHVQGGIDSDLPPSFPVSLCTYNGISPVAVYLHIERLNRLILPRSLVPVAVHPEYGFF